MASQRFEFEKVNLLGATALGQPGQRTFYLFAGDRRRWARFWLEKEELQMLSVAIDEVLDIVSEEEASTTHRAPAQEPSDPPAIEFKVGRLALAYDEAKDRVGLLAFESVEAEDEEPPTVVCWASRKQAQSLSQRIREVVAAGRPLCQLCGGPINPDGHICPRLNGHIAGRLQ